MTNEETTMEKAIPAGLVIIVMVLAICTGNVVFSVSLFFVVFVTTFVYLQCRKNLSHDETMEVGKIDDGGKII